LPSVEFRVKFRHATSVHKALFGHILNALKRETQLVSFQSLIIGSASCADDHSARF